MRDMQGRRQWLSAQLQGGSETSYTLKVIPSMMSQERKKPEPTRQERVKKA